MIRLKTIAAALALTTGLCIVGCSGNSLEPSPGPDAAPAVTTPDNNAAADLVLTVGVIGGDTKKITAPNAATLESETRAIDWTDTTVRHMVHLARTDKDGASVVKIQGSLGMPNEDGIFRAIVSIGNNDGVSLDAASPALGDIDAAIELLLLVESDREKLKNIANSWPNPDDE